MTLRTISNSRLIDGAKLDMLPNPVGDMTKAVYDPTNVGGDAFSMGNMVETSTKKILTDTERTKITNTSGTNTGDETASTIKDKLGISTLSGSNTGDQTLPVFAVGTVSGANGTTSTVSHGLGKTPSKILFDCVNNSTSGCHGYYDGSTNYCAHNTGLSTTSCIVMSTVSATCTFTSSDFTLSRTNDGRATRVRWFAYA